MKKIIKIIATIFMLCLFVSCNNISVNNNNGSDNNIKNGNDNGIILLNSNVPDGSSPENSIEPTSENSQEEQDVMGSERVATLVINDVTIETSNESNTMKAFVKDGEVYIPASIVGKAFNEQTKWDETTNTLYFGTVPGEKTYLLDICQPYEESQFEDSMNKSFTVHGKNYSKGFILYSAEGQVNFNLDGKYQTLKFDMGHIDDTWAGKITLTPYLDDKALDTIIMDSEDLITPVIIPLKNALRLKLVWTSDFQAAYGCANAEIE